MTRRLAAVDLPRVVEAAADTVRPAATAKGVELNLALDPACGSLTGDAERLQQVCWNLLAVQDTGQGIRPKFLPYVFERFHQADAGATRAHGGLGLGLAIVRHLVELHGGTVHAHSEGEGRGALLTVRLPRASVSAHQPVASTSPQALATSDPR